MGNKFGRGSRPSKKGASAVKSHESEDEETKLPHRMELINEAKEDFRKANHLFRESRIEEAKTMYSAAVSKLMECEDTSDVKRDQAVALSNLGVINFAEGRHEEAKHLLTEADRHRKELIEEEPSPKDISITSLTIAIKRDISVRRLLPTEQVLVAELREHGNIDSITADLMNNLGACNEVSGDLEQAQHFYEESLKLRKVVFGERSLKAAESMQNLATIMDSLGKLSEAERLLTEALAIEQEVRGADSVDASVTMNNLGVLCAHLGNLQRAQELLARAHTIRVKEYGKHHHLTICARQNLDYVSNQIKNEAAAKAAGRGGPSSASGGNGTGAGTSADAETGSKGMGTVGVTGGVVDVGPSAGVLPKHAEDMKESADV